LENPELRSLTWALSNNGFVNPALRSNGADSYWTMGASLVKVWGEGDLPQDLKGNVHETFDELLPLFRRIVAL
jgi:hypothetical protein